jgi:hypothetical protein
VCQVEGGLIFYTNFEENEGERGTSLRRAPYRSILYSPVPVGTTSANVFQSHAYVRLFYVCFEIIIVLLY